MWDVIGFSAFQYNTTVKLDIAKMWDVIGFSAFQYNTTVKPYIDNYPLN